MSGDLVRIGKTRARAQRVNISGSDADVVVKAGIGVGLPAGDVVTDDGIVIESGHVSASLESAGVNLRNALRLGALIDGTRDELVVCVTPLAVNEDILGSLTWQELW